MKSEHIINVQGSEFVKYEGLLDEAHQQGLCRIATTLIQVPHPDNGNVAIVAAEVETSKGTFSGIGDCSPANTSRMIAPHMIRMAETRAKARALRDAVNIGVTAIEELGEMDGGTSFNETRPQALGTPSFNESSESYRTEAPKASPFKPASANQLATIAKLSRLLGQPDESSEGMTSAEASERITELSRDYNERKAAPAGRRSA